MALLAVTALVAGTRPGSASTRVGAPAVANTAPNARSDSVSTALDTPASVNVLANDDDPDGDTLSVTDASMDFGNPGSVSCVSTGSCTYSPPSGFTGSSAFDYTISDGNGNSASAHVCVLVGAHGENGFAGHDFATDFYPNACNGEGPIGLGFDPSGQHNGLYVVYNNDLYRFGPAGGIVSPQTRIGSIDGGAVGLAFGKDGRLYVGRAGLNRDVVELDPATGTVLRSVGLDSDPLGMAVDPLSGDVFVSDRTYGVIHRLSDPASATPVESDYAHVGADGIAFGPDGTLYAAGLDGSIYRIAGTNQPDAGTVTHLADVLGGPDGIAVAKNNSFLLVNRNDGHITKIDLTTLDQTTVYEGGTRGDFSTVGPDGCLYATQSTSIIRVTNADGTCSLAFGSSASGKLEVRLALSPSNDPGRFDLQVDGATEKAAAGDGDTTGSLVVDAGGHTVGEVGNSGTGTSLSDYTTAIACKDQHGAGSIVAQSSNAGPLAVTVHSADDIVCTITNTRIANPVLTVSKIGHGSVASGDGGIDCGTTCSHTYPLGTAVTLTAHADSGWRFTGWSDPGCPGTGDCIVTLTGSKTVTATFEQLPSFGPGIVIFSREPDQSFGSIADIWSVDPNNPASATNITKNQALKAHAPSLSPDGTKIAFVSGPENAGTDVMVINSDGSGTIKNVTAGFHAQINEMWDPTWSPDGTKIAFMGGVPFGVASEKTDVYLVNADGTGTLTQLTNDGDVQDAAWSPVDSRIAFTRQAGTAGGLYTVDAGTDAVIPVDAPGCCASFREPAWSPDGTQLAFGYNVSAGAFAKIARVSSSGTGFMTLTTSAVIDSVSPSWSPDGHSIVFSRGFDLFVMSATTGEAGGLTEITSTADRDQDPWWGVPATSPPPAATQTALASSANPSVVGQHVTYTATVTSGSGTPTGTVLFKDGANVIPFCAAQQLLLGQATCDVTYTSPGAHSITAAYTPDASNFQTSGSPPLTQTVNKAATTTSLDVSPASSSFGQQVTLTAAVNANLPGAGTPSGAVTFFDGASPIGFGTLDGTGHATLLTSTLAPGTHSLTASYAGDTNFLASLSTAKSATVATVPGAPTGVTATAGDASATVSWAAPASDGGSPITGYVVTPYVGTTAQTPVNVGNVTSTTVSGLTNGTTYTFKVAAKNAIGTGLNSSASTAVTPHAGSSGVTLTIALNGSGHVTSSPAGIDCPGTCSMSVPSPAPIGYSLTLSETPAAGYGFYGWYDATDTTSFLCAPNLGPTCTISSLAHDTTVRASFYHLPKPDGTGAAGAGKIVYAYMSGPFGANSDIWIANPDGTGAGDVTNGLDLWSRTPALSPDGSKIAFAAKIGGVGNEDIYIINTDGTGLTNVTSRFAGQFGGAARTFWHPSWSPDGTQLAFQGANSPFDPPHTLVSSTDIYVTNGSVLTRITRVEDAQWASWSPNGDRIAYTRLLSGRTATNGIWTVKPDGSDPQLVLNESDAAMAFTDPEWSPDGTKFVFGAIPAAQGAGCFDKIFTVNANGTNLRNLVPNAWDCNDTDPTWSPDGNHIAFVRTEYQFPTQTVRQRDIFVMDATTGDAGELAAVTQSPEGSDDYGEREPNWRVPSEAIAKPTQTTVTSSANPSVTGQGVTYTATVAAAGLGGLARATAAVAATPTGSVTFADGGAPIAGCASLVLASGQASCTLSYSAAGLHSVTAAFTPASGNFAASNSPSTAQTVNRASATTLLSLSPLSSSFGQIVTLTATVGVLLPGAGVPTGLVTFLDGSSVLGTVPLDGSGHATLLTSVLTPGTHSVTAAYAGDGNFVGAASAAASASVLTVPSAPSGLSAGAGNAAASVSWSAPASDGGSAVLGYVITPYVGGAAQASVSLGNVTSTTVTGLANGTTYTFRVAARNAVGTGAQSDASNAVTPTAPVTATAPGAPTSVSASAGNASASIGWSPPASDGGSPILGYVVTPYVGTTALAAVSVGNVGSTTVAGLTNGTSYTFKVAARNAIGTGPASAASNAVTPSAPFTPPPVRKCVVPNVVGRLLAAAKSAIRADGCSVGTISYARSTQAHKGRVLAQSVRPHKKLKRRAKIGLIVGRGLR